MLSGFQRPRPQRIAAAAIVAALLSAPAAAQQPVSPPRPATVDTQRLDSLRRALRTPTDSLRRAEADALRFAANPIQQRRARPVAPVRPVSRADSLRRPIGTDGVYDVILDVPNVSVDEIVLQVDGVRAHVSLDARVAKLVMLSVGADVAIERVHLGIRGVQAEAHLRVDLDNVTAIVDRVLTTIDRNPEIVAGLLKTLETTVATVGGVATTALQPGGVVSEAVRTVGGVAQTALQPGGVVSEALQTVGGVANTALQPGGVVSGLVGAVGTTLQNLTGPGGLLSSQGINALGQTLVRTVDATGRIVERTVDRAGSIVGENVVGSVLQLPVVGQGTGPGGQIVRTVQDVSGALIGITLDAAGNVLGTDVLRGVGGGVAGGANRIVGEAAGDVELTPGRAPSRAGGGVDAVGNVLGTVSGAAANMLQQLVLSSSLNPDGRTVQRVVELTGAIVERVVDPATARILARKDLGNALRLPLVREQMDPSGSLVRVVRDVSGSLIELTLTPTGMLGRLRLLQLGPSGASRDAANPAATAAAAAVPVGTWLIGQVADSLGGTVQRLVDASGKIVERAVDSAGRVVRQQDVGSVLALAPVNETRGTDGRVVRLVRDAAGTLLEVILGASGQVELVRSLAGAVPGSR